MTLRLTIKNYRCFVEPVTIEINKGFTAFVGVNNAGKSTLIRFLYEMRPLFELLSQPSALLAQSLSGFPASPTFKPLGVFDPTEIFSNANADNGIEVRLNLPASAASPQSPLSATPSSPPVTGAVFNIERDLSFRTTLRLGDACLHVDRQTSPFVRNDRLILNGSAQADLRQLHESLMLLRNSLYIGPFRNAINVGTRTNYLDIQIGEAFIKHFQTLKTGPIKAHNIGIQNLTADIQRIFEFDSLDIASSADGTSLHITINGKPYKQHELGSGLAQFIIVLANAAIKKPQLILIDEPELNLHPRLQLDFVTTLGSYATHAVLFSTHSLGLTRSAADRIHSVVRMNDGTSAVRPFEKTPRLAEFLGEMSFSSHSELGFDKILLVEGPTEVKVMQQFLRKMKKDHRVVLISMNGRIPKVDEIEEILRITPKIAVVVDSERENAGGPMKNDRKCLAELCQQKNIQCLVLERRATENYFSDTAVKAVFGDGYRALGHYGRLSAVEPHWGKTDNWKIAAAMTLEEFKDTDLGRFLQDL